MDYTPVFVAPTASRIGHFERSHFEPTRSDGRGRGIGATCRTSGIFISLHAFGPNHPDVSSDHGKMRKRPHIVLQGVENYICPVHLAAL